MREALFLRAARMDDGVASDVDTEGSEAVRSVICLLPGTATYEAGTLTLPVGIRCAMHVGSVPDYPSTDNKKALERFCRNGAGSNSPFFVKDPADTNYFGGGGTFVENMSRSSFH